MAAPTFADVTISVAGNGDVTYTSTESERIRAFALDISVSTGVINEIREYKEDGYSTSGSKGYGIYMTAIDLTNPADPCWGDPVADPAENPHSVGKIPGSAITVELGSLYDGETNAPVQATGKLCRLCVSEACDVTIALNTDIGGIILEGDPPTSAALNVASGGSITEVNCEPGGKPECWLNDQFCRGDGGSAANYPDGGAGDGVVNTDDWPPFRDSFQKTYPDGSYNPCGDFNMDGTVNTDDWPHFRDFFQTTPHDGMTPDPPGPGPCPAPGAWPPGS
jgi:hypothetical protein